MPWWFVLFVALYVWDGVGGIRDDARRAAVGARPRWFVVAGSLSLVAAMVLLIALWDARVARMVDGLALPLLAVSVGFQALSAITDARALSTDYPGFTPAQRRKAAIVAWIWTVLLEIPVTYAGVSLALGRSPVAT